MPLLVALLLPGCLYLGEVNQAPSASLTVGDGPTTLVKGVALPLEATLYDPEDGYTLVPRWSIHLTDNSDQPCDYTLSFTDYTQKDATITFFRTGMWVISVDTVDKLNAPSNTSTVMVTVLDAPPVFANTMDLSAQSASDSECGTYVAGQPLALFLNGDVSDADAVLHPAPGCSTTQYDETMTYRWQLEGLPADSNAVLGPKPSKDSSLLGDGDCPPSPTPGLTKIYLPGASNAPKAACLYTDVGGGVAVPDTYQIALYVSDGTTEIRSNLFSALVRIDLPPCMTGVTPAAGSYVVDRSEPQDFMVTGVVDDLDPFGSPTLSFVWSVWREQDPTWRQVPDWSLPSYELDASSFGVGEKVRVRVEPADRMGLRAVCDDSADACVIDSCLVPPGQSCQAWMTWDLELR